jgi:trehalose 6-phosphate synthase
MWTEDSLRGLINERLGDHPFIVISYREPYIHTFEGRKIQCISPPSGLATALDPLMRASQGLWIACGTGEADGMVVDEESKIGVPPQNPEYTLKRIWLSHDEERGFYWGFSNEALWPLCHIAFASPTFNEDDWNIYKAVNRLFADAVMAEVGSKKALVFIQDYHFALLPRLLKQLNPELIVAQFWHIPWPNHEVFRICPWHEEIVDGLLGNDLLGFHIQYHCLNFLETVDRSLESRIDRENSVVVRGGEKTLVKPFPISVDAEALSRNAESLEVEEEIERVVDEYDLEGKCIGIGIDRIDYTKGIPERFKALDRLWEKYPEEKEKVVFVQLGAPSRMRSGGYWSINDRISRMVEDINWKYGTRTWKPIIYLRGNNSPTTLAAFRHIAHFCIVSSLHDGMNLVAKEYISSQTDEDGVLILSEFTGAAKELRDALEINPYDTDDFTQKIVTAIHMDPQERRERMIRLREQVKENNIYTWGSNIVSEILSLKGD